MCSYLKILGWVKVAFFQVENLAGKNRIRKKFCVKKSSWSKTLAKKIDQVKNTRENFRAGEKREAEKSTADEQKMKNERKNRRQMNGLLKMNAFFEMKMNGKIIEKKILGLGFLVFYNRFFRFDLENRV